MVCEGICFWSTVLTPRGPQNASHIKDVRIPGRMPGACVLHDSVSVFPCHVQPLEGGHVAKHRSSPPSYLPIQELLVQGGKTRHGGSCVCVYVYVCVCVCVCVPSLLSSLKLSDSTGYEPDDRPAPIHRIALNVKVRGTGVPHS